MKKTNNFILTICFALASLLCNIRVQAQNTTFSLSKVCDCDTAYTLNDSTLVIGDDTVTLTTDKRLDSVSLIGNTSIVYYVAGSPVDTIRISDLANDLLVDANFVDALSDSVGDNLLEDTAFLDELSDSIGDILLEDTAFLNALQDSIDTKLDSVTENADSTVFYYWVDGSIVDSINILNPSLVENLRDTLLQDQTFRDSIYSSTIDSLLNDTAVLRELQDSIDTKLDSVTENADSTVFYYWVDGSIVDSINILNPSLVENLRDTLLQDQTFRDSIYSSTIDSLLNDTAVLRELQDSIDTKLDSVTENADSTVFYYWVDGSIVDSINILNPSLVENLRDTLLQDQTFRDSIYSSTIDSLLNDTAVLRELQDSIDTKLDSVTENADSTVFYYWVDGSIVDSINILNPSLVENLRDTLLQDQTFRDSIYSSTIDSLLNDTAVLRELQDSIDTKLDSVTENADSTVFYYWVDGSIVDSINILNPSLVENLRDTLLQDQTFRDSIYSSTIDSLLNDTAVLRELQDSIDTKLDSVTENADSTVFYYWVDGSIVDSINILNPSLVENLRDTLLQDQTFRDSIYSSTIDSLLNDTAVLRELQDSIDTKLDSVTENADSTVFYYWVDGSIVDSINILNPSLVENLRDTLLQDQTFRDSIYSSTIDSLLNDTAVLRELQDSIDTKLDSVTENADSTVFYYWVDGSIVDSINILNPSLVENLRDTLLQDQTFRDSIYSSTIDSLLNDTAVLRELQDSIDTKLDSVTENADSTVFYYWVDGSIVDSINILNPSLVENLRDTLLQDQTFRDSIYSSTIDSLLNDTAVLRELQDSIDTKLDSVTENVDSTVFYYWVDGSIVDSINILNPSLVENLRDTLLQDQTFRDSIYSSTIDSLLNDTAVLRELQDSIDTKLDSVTENADSTVFYYWVDGSIVDSINILNPSLVENLRDTLLQDQTFRDSIYSSTIDSLLNDTAVLRELQDSIDTKLDSVTENADSTVFYYWVDGSIVDSINILNPSLVENLRDTLLQDQTFRDSIYSSTIDSLLNDTAVLRELQDSIDTKLDSVTENADSTVFYYWVDGSIVDSINILNPSLVENLRDTLLQDQTFRDSIYSSTIDSLLNDTAVLRELQDSIDTYLESVTDNNDTFRFFVDGVAVDSVRDSRLDSITHNNDSSVNYFWIDGSKMDSTFVKVYPFGHYQSNTAQSNLTTGGWRRIHFDEIEEQNRDMVTTAPFTITPTETGYYLITGLITITVNLRNDVAAAIKGNLAVSIRDEATSTYIEFTKAWYPNASATPGTPSTIGAVGSAIVKLEQGKSYGIYLFQGLTSTPTEITLLGSAGGADNCQIQIKKLP